MGSMMNRGMSGRISRSQFTLPKRFLVTTRFTSLMADDCSTVLPSDWDGMGRPREEILHACKQ